jgi:hypothetical protein
MDFVRSEVFGAEERHEHVDGHANGGGDVEAGDEHVQTRLSNTA